MVSFRAMLTSSLLLAGIAGPAFAEPGDRAVLQGLDKVTARISTHVVPLDEPMKFGSLEIVVRHCDRAPPEEPPEGKAFLEITEMREDEPPRRLFTGWMFASSPAISALEHPVYDVWVKECLLPDPPGEGGETTAPGSSG